MIERLVVWAIDRRVTVLVATLVLTAIMAIVARSLELDALPDITNNQVVVLATAPGFTPEEVELRVARPIEMALGGIPGLVTQRSISRYGIASVTAVFADDVDQAVARQRVGERIAALAGSLPDGVSAPELGPYTGGLGEVFQFTLRSASRSPAELLELVELRVAPLLRTVPGVVEVNSWGGAARTLDVVADPVRMETFGVSLPELEETLASASVSRPGASLPSGTRQTLVRAVSSPRGGVELGETVIRGESESGRAVRVSDVAAVRSGTAPRLGAATGDGGGELVYCMAQMTRGENALEVVSAIEARMEDVRRALPSDVRVDVVYDRGVLVRKTLRTVFTNLAEGGVLVSFVLFVLLGSVRAGLLVAITIPLAMLAATAAMVFFEIPGNLMSLGAIDFGLLVDGAIVMVEAFFHALAHGDGVDEEGTIRDAARSVARPVFFSVLIIALVYVPILTLRGVDGKMFRPMAITVVCALLASLALALTFIPAASSFLIRRRVVPTQVPWVLRLASRLHRPMLEWGVARPGRVAAMAGLALLGGGVLLSRAGTEFVPQLDEGDLILQTTRASDVRLESAIADAGRLEAALLERVPEVRRIASRIGSPAVATDMMGLEQADVFVGLAPRDEYRPGLTRDALLAEIAAVIEEHEPSADVDFTQPIQMRFNELLAGSVSDVTLTLFGSDLEGLRRLAERAEGIIESVPGATDVRISAPPAVSLVELRPDRLHAAHVGFSTEQVVSAVQALRYGVPVGETFDGPIRVPIRLFLAGAESVHELPRILVPGAGGKLVPLERVATIEHREAPGAVEHTDGERRITVGFNVRGADLGTVVSTLEARLGRELGAPPGIRTVFGGQYETMEAAYSRLAIVVPAVLLMIVALLTFMFRSLRAALAIFLNVPFAGVGGIVAIALRGMPLSVSASVGFIALSGIAVLNGVVLMTRVRALESAGEPPREAARLAALERMRPVLMTAGVAALGFVPMMLASGVGAEVQRPLATVVVGGLVTSTLLTLLVLPSLYPWIAGTRRSA